jgi:hypothetical protein
VTLMEVASKLAAKRIGAIVIVGAGGEVTGTYLRARHHPRLVDARACLPHNASLSEHEQEGRYL